MISKILFPVDGSDDSKKPFNHVLEIAKKFSASIILLHAYETPKQVGILDGSYALDSGFIDNAEENLISNGTYLVNETKSLIEQHDVKVTTALAKGDPGPAIIEIAISEACDLIIMSGKKPGIIERFFVGSVSDYVIHNTEIPVLLIH